MAWRIDKLLQRFRVFLGFVFVPIFFIFARPTVATMAVGFAPAVMGLVIRGWACGHLRKTNELDVSGPYAYTRNPLYFGSFLIAVGMAIASGVGWLACVLLVYFLSIYLPVMNVERNELEQVFGDYREYAAAVPPFVPRVTRWKNSKRQFDFQLYLKNGEYNAALGLFLVAVILALKSYFFG